MESINKIILIIALSCILNCHMDLCGKIKYSPVRWPVPNGEMRDITSDYDENTKTNTLFYMACNITEVEGKKNKDQPCTIMMRKHRLPDEPTQHSCDLKFIWKDGFKKYPIRQMFPLKEDKILVRFHTVLIHENIVSKSIDLLSVIDVKNCRMKCLEFSDLKILYPLVVYDDYFQFLQFNEKLCKSTDLCWLTYDFKSKQIDNPKTVILPYYSPKNLTRFNILSVNSSSPIEGYFTYNKNLTSNHVDVYYSDLVKKNKKLTVLPCEKWSYNFPVSAAHKLFSICASTQRENEKRQVNVANEEGKGSIVEKLYTQETKDKFYCEQTDIDGYLMTAFNVYSVNLIAISMHNLPEGGMILAKGFYKDGKLTFQVFKYQVDGETRKLYELGLDDWPYEDASIKILENNDEYCFELFCSVLNIFNHRTIHHYVKCIAKGEMKIRFIDPANNAQLTRRVLGFKIIEFVKILRDNSGCINMQKVKNLDSNAQYFNL